MAAFHRNDLAAATVLLPGLPEPAAFHVQQAVEKCLKAVIVLSGHEPPKVHDLTRLYTLAKPLLDWSREEQWLNDVGSWATTTRYGALESVGPPTREAVGRALVSARELASEVRSKLA